MPRILSASEKSALVSLASTFRSGTPERKVILAWLAKSASPFDSRIDKIENYFDPLSDYPALYKELRNHRVSWTDFLREVASNVLGNGDPFAAVREFKLRLSDAALDDVESLASSIGETI